MCAVPPRSLERASAGFWFLWSCAGGVTAVAFHDAVAAAAAFVVVAVVVVAVVVGVVIVVVIVVLVIVGVFFRLMLMLFLWWGVRNLLRYPVKHQ